MRKKCLLIAIVSILFVAGVFSFHRLGYASELNFSVNTLIPENQTDRSKTYFDLRMKPSQNQTLEIMLRNNTDKDVKINPAIHSAKTNMNGVVEYGYNEIEEDPSLLYKMEDLVTTEKEILIPAKGTYRLKLQVNMPDEPFDGILAGGITLQETDYDTKESKEQGVSIGNKYAYVVAIILSENDQAVSPELQLHDVFPDQVNARNVIKANIQNKMPMFMNKMSVDAKVTKKGEKEVLYQSSQEGLQMAPNSNFNYPISLNGEKMQSGEYTLELTVASMGKTWNWKKDFKIESKLANTLNDTDVTASKDYTWVFVALGVFLVFSSILLVLFWYRRKKRKKHDVQEGKATDSVL
ncbi:DUF916 and DUF3324 domain-containing protein [Paenibacillus larvae]